MKGINLNTTTGYIFGTITSSTNVTEANGFPADFVGSHAFVLSLIDDDSGDRYGFQLIISRKKIIKMRVVYINNDDWVAL